MSEYTHVEISLTIDGKSIKKEFSCEEAGNKIIELLKLLAADRKEIATLKARVIELEDECENLGYEAMGEDL